MKINIEAPAQRQPPLMSKSDEAFAHDGVEFVWGSESLDVEALNDLFEKVSFPRRDPVRLRTALDNTHLTLWIRATTASRWARRHQLLGFARATSDGSLTATIWDVAIVPSWQRIGLGRALVERLVAALCREEIDTISLYAERNVILLYEKLGFQQDVRGMSGMAFQKKSQPGRALIGAAVDAAAPGAVAIAAVPAAS